MDRSDSINNKNIMFQKTAFILLLLLTMIIILQWADIREKKVMQSATVYEKCIRAEYNTTPSEYYNKHNTYPVCD